MTVSPKGLLCPGQKDDLLTNLMFVADGAMGQLTDSNKYYATPNFKRGKYRSNERDDFQAVSSYQEQQVPDLEGVMGQTIMVDAPTTIMLKGGVTKQYLVMDEWETELVPPPQNDPSWNKPPKVHKWAGSSCCGEYRNDLALQCDVCSTWFQTKNALMIYKKDDEKNKTAMEALYDGDIRWMTHDKRIAEDVEITIDTNNKVHDRVHSHEVYRICFLCHGKKKVISTNTT